jgi:hypothetical protein
MPIVKPLTGTKEMSMKDWILMSHEWISSFYSAGINPLQLIAAVDGLPPLAILLPTHPSMIVL